MRHSCKRSRSIKRDKRPHLQKVDKNKTFPFFLGGDDDGNLKIPLNLTSKFHKYDEKRKKNGKYKKNKEEIERRARRWPKASKTTYAPNLGLRTLAQTVPKHHRSCRALGMTQGPSTGCAWAKDAPKCRHGPCLAPRLRVSTGIGYFKLEPSLTPLHARGA